MATRRMVTLLALLTVAVPAAAQDAPPPPLQLTADVGFVNAAGNSDVTTLNVGEKLVFTRQRLKLTQQFSTVYGRTGDSTTTSQWRASLRGDYNFAGPVASAIPSPGSTAGSRRPLASPRTSSSGNGRRWMPSSGCPSTSRPPRPT